MIIAQTKDKESQVEALELLKLLGCRLDRNAGK
jgi:hypothetical protein